MKAALPTRHKRPDSVCLGGAGGREGTPSLDAFKERSLDDLGLSLWVTTCNEERCQISALLIWDLLLCPSNYGKPQTVSKSFGVYYVVSPPSSRSAWPIQWIYWRVDWFLSGYEVYYISDRGRFTRIFMPDKCKFRPVCSPAGLLDRPFRYSKYIGRRVDRPGQFACMRGAATFFSLQAEQPSWRVLFGHEKTSWLFAQILRGWISLPPAAAS